MSMSARYLQMVNLVTLGQIKAVEELIQKGGDVNEHDDVGYCPVFAAINRNDFDMLKLLINNGANIDIVDSFGETPLSQAKKLAVHEKSNKIVELIEQTLAERARPAP